MPVIVHESPPVERPIGASRPGSTDSEPWAFSAKENCNTANGEMTSTIPGSAPPIARYLALHFTEASNNEPEVLSVRARAGTLPPEAAYPTRPTRLQAGFKGWSTGPTYVDTWHGGGMPPASADVPLSSRYEGRDIADRGAGGPSLPPTAAEADAVAKGGTSAFTRGGTATFDGAAAPWGPMPSDREGWEWRAVAASAEGVEEAEAAREVRRDDPDLEVLAPLTEEQESALWEAAWQERAYALAPPSASDPHEAFVVPPTRFRGTEEGGVRRVGGARSYSTAPQGAGVSDASLVGEAARTAFADYPEEEEQPTWAREGGPLAPPSWAPNVERDRGAGLAPHISMAGGPEEQTAAPRLEPRRDSPFKHRKVFSDASRGPFGSPDVVEEGELAVMDLGPAPAIPSPPFPRSVKAAPPKDVE